MAKIYKNRLDWVKSISQEELEKRFKDAKTLAETAKKKISFYEEELERREQEVPLGVPLPEKDGAPFVGVYELGFSSEKSFFTFSERFQNYVTATRDNAKGEPIDIQVLLPLLPKGWVAMDKNNSWHWYKEKPYISKYYFCWNTGNQVSFIGGFNLKSAENWETSLKECGL